MSTPLIPTDTLVNKQAVCDLIAKQFDVMMFNTRALAVGNKDALAVRQEAQRQFGELFRRVAAIEGTSIAKITMPKAN